MLILEFFFINSGRVFKNSWKMNAMILEGFFCPYK